MTVKQDIKEVIIDMLVFTAAIVCIILLLGHSNVHLQGTIEGNMTMQRLGHDIDMREINLSFDGDVPLIFVVSCNSAFSSMEWEGR